MQKKLYRSRTSKTFAGVCGGLGQYLNIDPTLLRVLWVLVSIFFTVGFGGLIVYIVMACIIPEEPEGFEGYQQPYQSWAPPPQEYPPPYSPPPGPAAPPQDPPPVNSAN